MSIAREGIDSKFIALLFTTYCCLKGTLHLYLSSVQLPYYVAKKLSGEEYQILQSVSLVPFGLKGVIGVLSDQYPIGGRQKAPYAIIFTVIGSAAAFVLAQYHATVTPHVSALLFFLCYSQIAALDLLCEGKYAEIMKKHKSIKSKIVSYVWLLVNFGALLGSITIGLITDNFGYEIILWFSFILAAQSFLPLCTDPFPNDRRALYQPQDPVGNSVLTPSDLLSLANRRLQSKMSFAAMTTAILSLMYVIIALTQSHNVLVLYSIVASFVTCAAVFAALPPMIASTNLFLFLQEALHINLSGPLDRWYIAPASCIPGGPHFSLTFYQTYATTLSLIASWGGIWIWNVYFKRWNLRKLFVLMIALRVIASIFDLLLITRINLEYLYVGDKAFFLLGDSIVLPIISILGFLPAVILTSRMCPDRFEATAYAILAGSQNFGMNVSRAVGLYLADAGAIRTQEDPTCDFSSLPWLVFIGHIVAPMMNLPFIYLLLPNCVSDPGSKEDALTCPGENTANYHAGVELESLLINDQ